MSKYKTVMMDDRWAVKLPEHLADLPQWKFWEKERMAAMYAAIRPTDTILDIGTCNGDMSAVFASWIPQGKIILVEPSPDFWVYIKGIFEANGLTPAECWEVLVANEAPSDDWYDYKKRNPDLYPESAKLEMKLETGFAHISERPKIPVVKIDDMGLPKIDIITMDIEGTEYEALAGAEKVLLRDRPIVFVSVHPEFMWREHHHSTDDLHVMMKKLGYEPNYLAFDHEQHWMYKPTEVYYGK